MNERLKATDNSPTWRTKSGEVKMEEMSDDYLQSALHYAQERELFFFNRAQIFTEKIDQLLEEAKRRGVDVKLKDDVEFFRNTRKKPSKVK